MKNLRNLFLMLALLVPVMLTFAQQTADEALLSITAEELKGHIYYLASDEMNGRVATSPEYAKAAEYVAAQFAAAGLEPAITLEDGSKSFYQAVPFKKTVYDEKFTLKVTVNGKEKELIHNQDFKIMYGSQPDFDEVEVVWAGYGINEPEHNWNDFKNLDVAGKMVICLDGAPTKNGKAVLPQEVHDKYTGSRGVRHKLISGMADLGLAGIILIYPNDKQFNELTSRFTRERSGYDDPNRGSGRGGRSFTNALVAKPALLNVLLGEEKNNPFSAGYKDKNYQTGAVPGASISGKITILTEDNIPSPNVVGLVRGTDPVLKNEYIVVGAHLDHVRPRNGEVCNGADDNASGSSGVMEIAEAVAMNPMKRSVIFVTWTAEEMGLIGSRFFVGSDAFPKNSLKFNLNMDMIGRTSPDNESTRAHYVVSNKRYIDELEKFINGLNDGVTDFPLLYENDQDSPGGSDHMSFIDQDIPAFFFFSGLHPDLHNPGDDADKIDYPKAEKISQLGYLIVRNLANSDAVPDFLTK